MHRFALALLALTIFGFSSAFAQNAYVGGGVALTTFPNDGWPFCHVQVGQIQERLEYRAVFSTNAGVDGTFWNYLSADLLGTFPIFESPARIYIGGGAGAFLGNAGTPFGLTFILGSEYRTGTVGVFIEGHSVVWPGLLPEARAGLNFYF